MGANIMEDLPPKRQKKVTMDLSDLSIEALEEYIHELKAEIERVKRDMDVKKLAKQKADMFFK